MPKPWTYQTTHPVGHPYGRYEVEPTVYEELRRAELACDRESAALAKHYGTKDWPGLVLAHDPDPEMTFPWAVYSVYGGEA